MSPTTVMLLAGAITSVAIFLTLEARLRASRLKRSLETLRSRIAKVASDFTLQTADLSTHGERLATASQQQAAAIQQTVSAVDQINAISTKSAESTQESDQLAQKSIEITKNGASEVRELIIGMARISDFSQQMSSQVNSGNQKLMEIVKTISEISEKTKVINEIVFQTKLLSFNASVEAARAGEHGKGFAVVAEEVGTLAQKSGHAAKEISDLLENSVAHVKSIIHETTDTLKALVDDNAVEMRDGQLRANNCGQIFDQINHSAQRIGSAIEVVRDASREQAKGIQEVAKAMRQLDEVTYQNSKDSESTTQWAENLKSFTSELALALAGGEAAPPKDALSKPSDPFNQKKPKGRLAA